MIKVVNLSSAVRKSKSGTAENDHHSIPSPYIYNMTLTPDQKNHAAQLLEKGDKLKAVRYFQHTLGLEAEEALRLTEKLLEESKTTDSYQRIEQMKERMRKGGVNSKLPQRIGLGFMSIGLVMLLIIIYIAYTDYQFEQTAEPVTGTVVNYDSYYSSDDDGGGSTMYTPIFAYTYNGETLIYQSSTSSSSQDYYLGEEVEILVNPDAPHDVLVNTFWERWLISVILGFLGLMFTGMGYMAFRVFR